MLKILGRSSSINVRKVLWACGEIGLDFEQEEWGAGYRDARSPEFLKLNPNGLVPVVIDDGLVLWESDAIIRYLNDKYDGGLMPAEPGRRAIAEQWLCWQATEMNNAYRYAFVGLVRKHPDYGDAERIKASIADWIGMLGILDAALAEAGGHVAGEAFTLADIPVGLAVHRWYNTPVDDRPDHPAVAAYYERISARPGFNRHGCGDHA